MSIHDDDLFVEENDAPPHKGTMLAMQLWLKWKNSPEAQVAIPKKLIVEVMCQLDPGQELNIRSGTAKFKEKV